MKFTTVASFDKHIQESSLSHGYLIICSDRQERLHQIENVVKHLIKKCSDVQAISFDGEDHSFQAFAETLTTQPLFSSEVLCYLEDIGSFAKKHKERLSHLFSRPAPYAFLVAGVASLKDSAFITAEMKNDVVILDLSQEKPWQKSKRYQASVVQKAAMQGKVLPLDIAEKIVGALEPDSIAIEAELSKIITFIGERKAITLSDIAEVGIQNIDEGGWAMAEKLIFDGIVLPCGPAFEMGALIALLGQLRYFLHAVQDIAASKAHGHAPATTLRLAVIDKVHALLQKVDRGYCDEALAAVFRTELLCKNSTFTPALLWDMLAAHIIQKRRRHAKDGNTYTSSQRPRS